MNTTTQPPNTLMKEGLINKIDSWCGYDAAGDRLAYGLGLRGSWRDILANLAQCPDGRQDELKDIDIKRQELLDHLLCFVVALDNYDAIDPHIFEGEKNIEKIAADHIESLRDSRRLFDEARRFLDKYEGLSTPLLRQHMAMALLQNVHDRLGDKRKELKSLGKTIRSAKVGTIFIVTILLSFLWPVIAIIPAGMIVWGFVRQYRLDQEIKPLNEAIRQKGTALDEFTSCIHDENEIDASRMQARLANTSVQAGGKLIAIPPEFFALLKSSVAPDVREPVPTYIILPDNYPTEWLPTADDPNEGKRHERYHQWFLDYADATDIEDEYDFEILNRCETVMMPITWEGTYRVEGKLAQYRFKQKDDGTWYLGSKAEGQWVKKISPAPKTCIETLGQIRQIELEMLRDMAMQQAA